MAGNRKPFERALEDSVSRALRDNLAPLQRTAEELQQAYADFVAACSSARPTNALPSMLRAQAAAAALSAGLSVLSNFVVGAINSSGRQASAVVIAEPEPESEIETEPPAEAHAEPDATPEPVAAQEGEVPGEVDVAREPEPTEAAEEAAGAVPEAASAGNEEPASVPVEPEAPAPPPAEAEIPVLVPVVEAESATEVAVAEPESTAGEASFDVAALSPELQALHFRANRVAKVAMQDIQLLRPGEVQLGRENRDICSRLRSDLDKARKEYDRRFHAILDQPVDYFHRWMVEILAGGDGEALGDYPYPSPVLRH